MLPVATPPNAIVFGTDRISMRDMARVGVWLNLIGAVMITAAIAVVGRVVLGIELDVMPDWGEVGGWGIGAGDRGGVPTSFANLRPATRGLQCAIVFLHCA